MGIFRDSPSEKELRDLTGSLTKFYVKAQTGELPVDVYQEFVTDMGPRIKDLYFQVEREGGTRAADKVSIKWVFDTVRILSNFTSLSVPGTARQVEAVLKQVIGI